MGCIQRRTKDVELMALTHIRELPSASAVEQPFDAAIGDQKTCAGTNPSFEHDLAADWRKHAIRRDSQIVLP
jgi:hypothetical protein